MIEIGKDGLDMKHTKLKYDVSRVMTQQKHLLEELGNFKRKLQDLRATCDHPKKTKDKDGLVTCDVCQAIILGDIEWLK